PDREEERAATEDLAANLRIAVAARSARLQRQMCRDANDKEEERKDQVREGAAGPWAVPGLQKGGLCIAWIVHDQHSDDREAAKDVQRQKALLSGHPGYRLWQSVSGSERRHRKLI